MQLYDGSYLYLKGTSISPTQQPEMSVNSFWNGTELAAYFCWTNKQVPITNPLTLFIEVYQVNVPVCLMLGYGFQWSPLM